MDNPKKIYSVTIILIFISLLTLCIQSCQAQEMENESASTNAKTSLQYYGEGSNTFLDFYQKWISPIKGENTCPMYPSCSQYAKIAFEVLPWYKAYTLSLERLLRCGHELYLYPRVLINGQIKWYDRVSMNETINVHYIPKHHLHFGSSGFKSLDEDYYSHNIPDEGFADFLVKKGEYDRAISEYYRLLYTTENPAQKANILRKIGLCHFQDSDYEGYISFLKKNDTNFIADNIVHAEVILYLAKSYYHLNKYKNAISTLEWSTTTNNDSFFNETQFLLAISYARIFDSQMAMEKLSLIEPDSPNRITADHLIHSFANFPKLPRKSPFWAGTFSAVIPGSGYIYCHRPATGITSFLVNGLLIWAIRDAIVRKQYGLASAISFFELGWYIGNIKGSIEAAHSYNAKVRNQFIDRLLEKENLFEYIKNRYDLPVLKISVSLK
jgi:putative component of membrane protein insertase Oxa1/YidC/SpoIIIJ protein YidD